METLVNFGSAFFLLAGSFLCLSGGVGIVKFPDFYSRMHAVGVTETLATALVLFGLMLQAPDLVVLFKLMLILALTLFIAPTASHALAKAALHNGLSPKLDNAKSGVQVSSSKR